MLKKVFCVLACFCFIVPCCAVFVNGVEPTVSAESAIVMNALTGEVVFSKNPYEKRGIASTTKIMTAICAIENGDRSRLGVTAPPEGLYLNKVFYDEI